MKYIIGIDQSLSCTGVVVLNTHSNIVERIEHFKTKAPKPFYEVGLDNYSQTSARVVALLEQITQLLVDYPTEDTVICLERLTSGSSSKLMKSRDTDYVLSHLFYSLIKFLDESNYERYVISPSSHKMLFFPTGSGKLNKKEAYTKYWDFSFEKTGFVVADGQEFKTDDSKDAFCIAYFLHKRQSAEEVNIFSYRTGKQKKENYGRMLEAIKGSVCEERRLSKLCWGCVYYDFCDHKKKYTGPKKLTKKQQSFKDSLRKKVSDYLKSLDDKGIQYKFIK